MFSIKDTIFAAVIAVLVGLCVLQTVRLAGAEKATAAVRLEHAQVIADAENAARKQVSEAREEERRRYNALQEIAHETDRELASARADADAAALAGERLRKQLAAVTADLRRAATDSIIASTGATADAPADLLEVVQRRLDDAADGIARHADEARSAGLACERSYTALMGAK